MDWTLAKQLYTPELLIPGRKPIGHVKAKPNHPYLLGVETAWYLLEKGGLPQPSVNRHIWSDYGTPGWGDDGYEYTGTQESYIADDGNLGLSTTFTVIMDVRLTGISTWGGLIAKRKSGDTNNEFAVQRDGSGDEFRVVIGGVGGSDYVNLTSLVPSDITDGKRHVVTFSYDGTNVRAYLDGNKTDTETLAKTPGGTSDPIVVFGARVTGYTTQGTLRGLLWIPDKTLSDSEIRRISENFYDPLQPAGPQWLPISTGAAGPITGSGALALPLLTLGGTAEREVTGSGTPSIFVPTVAGTAEREVIGSGAIDLPLVTVDGTAAVGIAGTGALSIFVPTIAGAAEREITGSGTPDLPAATIAGTAGKGVSGSGALEIAIPTVDGVASKLGAITGSGALTLPNVTIDGVAAIDGVWTEVSAAGGLWTGVSAAGGSWTDI